MRRILSIDGGGIKGVFPVSFLATMEEKLEHPIGDYFDLIAGTSTGGIIALGLGLGLSAQQILEFYEQHGPVIFKGHNTLRYKIKQLVSGKYESANLEGALRETFSDRKLGESTKRLMIPSLNLQTGKPYIYKTAHAERLETDFERSVVEVALATSAAPTYFPIHRSVVDVDLVDGGIYANNPTGMAVVEALGTLDWDKADVVVLSIGCTESPPSFGAKRLRLGVRHWARPAVPLFMYGQSHFSMGIAYVLLDHNRVKRINPSVSADKAEMDNIDNIGYFKGLGHETGRYERTLLKDMFFFAPAEPFVPVYTLKQGV